MQGRVIVNPKDRRLQRVWFIGGESSSWAQNARPYDIDELATLRGSVRCACVCRVSVSLAGDGAADRSARECVRDGGENKASCL